MEMDPFLSQDGNLLLIFSYLDTKELCQVSRVCKAWWNLVNGRDTIWETMAKRMGLEECKYEDQSWKECVKDLYCPGAHLDIGKSGILPFHPKLECAACWRHVSAAAQKSLNTQRYNYGEDKDDLILSLEGSDEPPSNEDDPDAVLTLDQQSKNPYLTGKRICRVSHVVSNSAKMCVRCRHLVGEHCTHLQYRETQINKYLAAYARRDYEEMIKKTCAIVRVAGRTLRSQEKNLLTSSFNIYINVLKGDWRSSKNGSKQKEEATLKIVRVSLMLLKVLDDKIFPYIGIETVLRWIKLKIKFSEIILEVTSPSNETNANSTAAPIYEQLRAATLSEIGHLKEITDAVVSHHETVEIAKSSRQINPAVPNGHVVLPSNTFVIQCALSYSDYCVKILQNHMRAFRILLTLCNNIDECEDADNTLPLVLELKNHLQLMLDSKELKRLKPQKIVKQGYLRFKVAGSEELALPSWVVLGYWDYHSYIFIYPHIDAEEAKEMILMRKEVVLKLEDENDKSFGINGSEWYSTSRKERDEWYKAIDMERKRS